MRVVTSTVLTTLLLAGCGNSAKRAKSTLVHAPLTAAVLPKPQPERQRDPASLCERIAEEDAAAYGALPKCTDGGGGGFDAVGILEDVCKPTENGGAWTVAFSNLTFDPTCTKGAGAVEVMKGNYFVVRVDADGRRAQGPAHAFTASGFYRIRFQTSVFDYDADGLEEFAVIVSRPVHTDVGTQDGSVWTAQRTGVAVYAPASKIQFSELTDADEDGRPDLAFTAPFSGFDVAWFEGTNNELGREPPFVAHALPNGLFSLDDTVAREHAKKHCPVSPGAKVIIRDTAARKTAPIIDEGASIHAIACARVWGVPTDAIKRTILKECKVPTKTENIHSHGPSTCFSRDHMLQWANATPPLTL